MLENEPSLFIICDPFKVFADQFKVFKIVFYTGWSYFFFYIQSELYGRVSFVTDKPAPHERVVSLFLSQIAPRDSNSMWWEQLMFTC